MMTLTHFIKAVNMFLFEILVFCCIFSNIFAKDGSPPSVDVSQGKIIGVTMSSTSGRNFNAFIGIPYGKVVKRFDVPQKADPWTGNLMATGNKFRHMCYQYEPFIVREVIGTEDCLSLNVYTPHIPKSLDDALFPVMVYIFGGGFLVGFNHPALYGAQHLMDKDVVLVIMNYRVGFFGFLSTGDDAAQGNFGLWDQQLALQWVQENIQVFGGDKNKVTIFGESAGGASVIYHLLSPMSAGLFHGAIVQSGSAICPWALDRHDVEHAFSMAKRLNCPSEDTHEVVECLRKKDAEDITLGENISNYKLAPVIEVGSNEKFVPEHPYKMFQDGKFNKVPVIIGVVLDEGAFFYSYIKQYFNSTKEEFFAHGLKKTLGYFFDEGFIEGHFLNTTLYNEIVDIYYKDIKEPSAAYPEAMEMTSDIMFNGCTDITIKLLTAHDIPVFSYVFEYVSNVTEVTTYTGKPDVMHASELKYIFEPTGLHLDYSDEDLKFINSLLTMWTKFAELGDPTPDGSVMWDPTSPNGNQFLRIGREMRMDDNYIPERMAISTKLIKAFIEYQLA